MLIISQRLEKTNEGNGDLGQKIEDLQRLIEIMREFEKDADQEFLNSLKFTEKEFDEIVEEFSSIVYKQFIYLEKKKKPGLAKFDFKEVELSEEGEKYYKFHSQYLGRFVLAEWRPRVKDRYTFIKRIEYFNSFVKVFAEDIVINFLDGEEKVGDLDTSKIVVDNDVNQTLRNFERLLEIVKSRIFNE